MNFLKDMNHAKSMSFPVFELSRIQEMGRGKLCFFVIEVDGNCVMENAQLSILRVE